MYLLGWIFPIAVPAIVVAFCLIVQGRKDIARYFARRFKRPPSPEP